MIRRLIVSAVIGLATQHIGRTIKSRLTKPLRRGEGLPEIEAFDEQADAWVAHDKALRQAKNDGKRIIMVLGANWSRECRVLAGHLEGAYIQEVMSDYYNTLYIDVGRKNRNLDIARAYGVGSVEGVPTVIILSSRGEVLNKETLNTWSNATMRSKEDILTYFTAYARGRVVEAS